MAVRLPLCRQEQRERKRERKRERERERERERKKRLIASAASDVLPLLLLLLHVHSYLQVASSLISVFLHSLHTVVLDMYLSAMYFFSPSFAPLLFAFIFASLSFSEALFISSGALHDFRTALLRQ